MSIGWQYLVLFIVIGLAPLVYVVYQWTKEEYEKGDGYYDEY